MSLVRLLAIALGVVGAAVFYESVRSKKVFVSYKYSGDAKYKNLLVAWSKNHKFSVEFDDVSSDISIDSRVESVIKEGILPQIEKADIFLCIIGSKTHKSKMVNWEIQKAIELGKKIVAVKTSKENISPRIIKSSGAIWSMTFKEKDIIKALSEASS